MANADTKSATLIATLFKIHEQVSTTDGSMTYCKECGYRLRDTELCRTTAAIKNMDPAEAVTAIRDLHQPGTDHHEMCVDCGWPYGGWCPTRKLIEDALVDH